MIYLNGVFFLISPSAAPSSNARPKYSNPTRLIVGSFLIVILAGTLFLMLPVSNRDGNPLNFLDAFFTATSATCVTGLVVYDTFTQFSVFGQIVILLLIQVGGLGLVTLTTFFNIAIGRRLGFKSLRLASESINLSDASHARALLMFVIKVAFTFEAIGALLLSLRFVPEFHAKGIFISVFLSISAFCNAGFDILGFIMPGGSLIPYQNDPYVLTVISLLIISGGLGFLVWQDLSMYRRTHHLRTHTKLVLCITGFLLLLGTVGIFLLEFRNPLTLGSMSLVDQISNAAFQSVSARTAGFNSVPLNDMTNFTKIFMSILMFIGAAPGGTGGGIKVTTISVILVAVASVIRGRDEAMINDRMIDHKTVYKSLTILMLSLLAVTVASLSLFYDIGNGVSEVDCVFEAVSAFGTVGLSVGVTALMNPFAQIVTIITMFIGRVGPVSLAISLSAQKDTAASRRVVHPQAHISVG